MTSFRDIPTYSLPRPRLADSYTKLRYALIATCGGISHYCKPILQVLTAFIGGTLGIPYPSPPRQQKLMLTDGIAIPKPGCTGSQAELRIPLIKVCHSQNLSYVRTSS